MSLGSLGLILMWTVQIIVVFQRQERSHLLCDLMHLMAAAASYMWIFLPLTSLSAFRLVSSCWILDTQIEIPGDSCHLVCLKCCSWLPCDFFFFLCSQTPLVLLLLLILNNAPTRPLSQTWVSAVSPSQVDLSLPWLSFPNLPFPVMPRPGLRAPSLSITATPSLVVLPVSAVFHVATRTAFFMPGHGPLTNSGDTQMPPEKHLTPSVTIRTKGSCLYRNDCRVIQGCCFHFQPYFLPQPPYHLSQRTSHPCISVWGPFTASWLHTFFFGGGGIRILAWSGVPGSPCHVGGWLSLILLWAFLEYLFPDPTFPSHPGV